MRSSSLARRPPAVRTLSPASWRRVALPFGFLALEIERTDLAGQMTREETAAVELELLRWRGRVNRQYQR